MGWLGKRKQDFFFFKPMVGIWWRFWDKFLYFYIKIYVAGTHYNRLTVVILVLTGAILVSTHNIYFSWEIVLQLLWNSHFYLFFLNLTYFCRTGFQHVRFPRQAGTPSSPSTSVWAQILGTPPRQTSSSPHHRTGTSSFETWTIWIVPLDPKIAELYCI